MQKKTDQMIYMMRNNNSDQSVVYQLSQSDAMGYSSRVKYIAELLE